ncbi:MAG: hypothetical protein HZA92_03655 [Verrucomicrobia bacterium]|nr:hypothetical protein [Verrucomicrobiota bacterium]
MSILAAIPSNFSGFTAEGPMFWTLIVLLGCLVYMRTGQRFMERQAKVEAENARRQEQTYQAMVQHYRQVANEQQMRMDSGGLHGHHAPPAASSGGALELFQLLSESSLQKFSKLDVRVESLAKELAATRRELEESTVMATQLLGVISDMQHKMNNLSNAMHAVLEKE